MTEGAIPGQIKGSIKLHKSEEPLREVCDNTNAPGHKLAKVLNRMFDSYTGQTMTAVKGGPDLIKMIHNGRFNKCFLASCDAVALYPSIIVEEGLEILEAKITQDKHWKKKTDLDKEEVIELVRLCAENPYFECEFGFFRQNGGTHMGGALSRLLADLIIEEKIESVLQKHEKWGKIWGWVRLVDDTLAGWSSKEEFQEFFTYLNTIHPGIQSFCEMEEESKLPIFDILIMRTEVDTFKTTVYMKPSASNKYIHYTSARAWKESQNICGIEKLLLD